MRLRVTLVFVGSVAMVYAVWQLAIGGVVTSPVTSGLWVVGAALAHDLVLAPFVAITGLLLARLAPPAVRPVIAGGLVVTGCLLLISIPLLLDRGGEGNPTTTPLDYPRGLLLAVGVVLVVTLLLVILQASRTLGLGRRRAPEQPAPARGD